MDINSLKRDSAAIDGGQWVSDLPGMGDLRLKVRGLTSRQATTLRSSLERKAPKEDRNKDYSLTFEAEERIDTEVLHQSVLLDWDGLTEGGVPVNYDAELARKWLGDPDYLPFARAVRFAAIIVDNGNEETTEALAVNLPKPSAGK